MSFATHSNVPMADEIELDLDAEEHPIDKRITKLNEKLGSVSKDLDEEKQAREAEAQKRAEAERERDFYAGFSDVVSDNPAAKDHKDEIKEKVLKGYSVEDATYAVLGKANKLGVKEEVKPIVDNPAGGSAVTNPPAGGQKSVSEMTQAERREKLVELEKRGDISMT